MSDLYNYNIKNVKNLDEYLYWWDGWAEISTYWVTYLTICLKLYINEVLYRQNMII